ncbi:uncharacterized protein K452DRAFT_283249 [Aplosporella prunicola CBS 121167]|uniref:Uncharacterized protein n=1 Tax=Aplosporella prunicola CBS 121167 TaxID=1176127 RepID=A0A6A6BPD1_9PEZI|nr:uncharacterized protein K452DRAFT_283249 [Aplosporella prunicola CBS 121167]KAF2145952.1 hypothetical protein K452DRAFT_283249 [Aplosporella prunicola CBS 121167]
MSSVHWWLLLYGVALLGVGGRVVRWVGLGAAWASCGAGFFVVASAERGWDGAIAGRVVRPGLGGGRDSAYL